MISKKLIPWFLNNRRSFPWREDLTPYHVWISEIMLQQTRAEVVVPYFNRWFETFPSIQELANGSIEEVIKLWEGLGYYSRARNIHKTAQMVCEKYGSELPEDRATLESLPGIGPYTAGAILSFAYGQKQVALDGNVMRVISRLFLIEENISLPKVQKKLEKLAYQLLPDHNPHYTMEGLIELGALICKKSPLCFSCPLKTECLANIEGKSSLLPIKNQPKKTKKIDQLLFCIQYENQILITKREEKGVMRGLWEFPYQSLLQKPPQKGKKRTSFSQALVRQIFGEEISNLLLLEGEITEQFHSFTHYRATLYPLIYQVPSSFYSTYYKWVTIKEATNLPFSSGHKKILYAIIQRNREMLKKTTN